MRFIEPFPCDVCEVVPEGTAPFFVDFSRVGIGVDERETVSALAYGYVCPGCSAPLAQFTRDRAWGVGALLWLVAGFWWVPMATAVMPWPVAVLLAVAPLTVAMVRVVRFHRSMAERLFPEAMRAALLDALPRAEGVLTWRQVRVYPGSPPRKAGALSALRRPKRGW